MRKMVEEVEEVEEGSGSFTALLLIRYLVYL